MRGSWITDLRHFLDEGGTTSNLPPPATKIANYFGSIVEAVTSQPGKRISAAAMGIKCRRRPGRKRCAGEIVAFIDEDTLRVHWQCPVCGDKGIISGWQDTIWDLRFLGGNHPPTG
jgi:PHP family Zn ribbon phosphoesterase